MSQALRVPNFDLEFDRKIVAALEQAMHKHSTGAISSHAYSAVLCSLNTASRGLIEEQISLAIDAERDLVDAKVDVEDVTSITMAKPSGSLVVLTHERNAALVKLTTHQGDSLPGVRVFCSDSDDAPCEMAIQRYEKLRKGLIAKGYREII